MSSLTVQVGEPDEVEHILAVDHEPGAACLPSAAAASFVRATVPAEHATVCGSQLCSGKEHAERFVVIVDHDDRARRRDAASIGIDESRVVGGVHGDGIACAIGDPEPAEVDFVVPDLLVGFRWR